MAYFIRECEECNWVLYNTEVEECPLCHKKLKFKTQKSEKEE